VRWPLLSRSRAADAAKFGFAVVGLGHGARKFIEALRGSPTVRVAALVSGDLAKAQRLARSHDVDAALAYESFEALADEPHVQAVYLCLPNHLHREFTERAARIGKHVLCEKPMAPSVADCRAMMAACDAAGRLLALGYRLPFTSVYQRARELLAGGALGEVEAVRSGFGFVAKPGWRVEAGLAGSGSMFDVGVYPVNALHHFFPQGFVVEGAVAERAPGTQVEVATEWHGRLAVNSAAIQCRSSFRAKIPDFFEVNTALARLSLEPAFSYDGLRLRVRAHRSADRNLDLAYATPRGEPSGFRLEAEHLAECAASGKALRNSAAIGLRDVEALEEILRASELRN
jgi:predicted dehydrogenase